MKMNLIVLLVLGIVATEAFALPEYGSRILVKNNSKYLLYTQLFNDDWEGPRYFFEDLLPGGTAELLLSFKKVPSVLTIAVKQILPKLLWDVRWRNNVSSQQDPRVLSITYKINLLSDKPSFVEIDKGSGRGRLDFTFFSCRPIEIIIDEELNLILPSQE